MGIKSVKQQGLGGLDITLLKSQGNLATGGSVGQSSDTDMAVLFLINQAFSSIRICTSFQGRLYTWK